MICVMCGAKCVYSEKLPFIFQRRPLACHTINIFPLKTSPPPPRHHLLQLQGVLLLLLHLLLHLILDLLHHGREWTSSSSEYWVRAITPHSSRADKISSKSRSQAHFKMFLQSSRLLPLHMRLSKMGSMPIIIGTA